jgi:hypothetical protein
MDCVTKIARSGERASHRLGGQRFAGKNTKVGRFLKLSCKAGPFFFSPPIFKSGEKKHAAQCATYLCFKFLKT